MPAFVIPTIFTARETMGPVAARMQGYLHNVNASAVRATGNLKSLTSQMLAYGGVASSIGIAASGLLFSGKSIMDYEKELANLRALTGVTGEDFKKFKVIIQSTARESKTSSVEVVKAFTTVANAMPELLQSAEGLGQVTSASILLGKAARMDVAPAAEAVTTILNKYGQSAKDASVLVDMMAAGSKYGSAEITDLALSLREFGGAAQIAGASLRESISITELVSKIKKGTEAGIQLRNLFIYLDTIKGQDPKGLKDLQRLGVQTSIVVDKTLPLISRLRELSKISKDGQALKDIFGKENFEAVAYALQNVEKLQPLIDRMGEVGVANQMAAENTGTLYVAIQQLSAKWVTLLTNAESATVGLAIVTGVVHMLTNNMELLLAIIVPSIAIWVAYKATVLGVRAAIFAYNVVTGLAAGFTSNLSIALMENTIAARAETVAIRIRTAATWLGVSATTALSIATGGFLLIGAGLISYLTTAHNKSDVLTDSIDRMSNKLKAIREPITEATIALRLYNKAVEEHSAKSDENALFNYNMKNNPVGTVTNEFLAHPITSLLNLATFGQMVTPAITSQPDKANFPGLDPNAPTESVNEEYVSGVDGGGNNYSIDRRGNLKIIIDNKTNNPVSVDNGGSAIPVTVKQTGTYKR